MDISFIFFVFFLYLASVFLVYRKLQKEYLEMPPCCEEDKMTDYFWMFTPILNLFLLLED